MDNIQRTIGAQGGGIFNQAEVLFDDLFIRKAPALPAQMQDLLVKLAPFWAIVLIIFSVIGTLFGSLSVLFGLLSTLLSVVGFSGTGLITSILGIVQSVVGLGLGLVVLFFLAKSLSGLFNPRAEGWRLLFRAEVVLAINSAIGWVLGILTLILSFSGLGVIAGIGGAILALPFGVVLYGLSFYLLFQIKHKYF